MKNLAIVFGTILAIFSINSQADILTDVKSIHCNFAQTNQFVRVEITDINRPAKSAIATVKIISVSDVTVKSVSKPVVIAKKGTQTVLALDDLDSDNAIIINKPMGANNAIYLTSDMNTLADANIGVCELLK